MPAPIPDASRDQQCHHYQAPTGHRCGSPAMRGQYYCFQHQIRRDKRASNRVLIDPELTRLEIPILEDRGSIFVAIAAVVHKLADNTIDTRRAGQMLYGLQALLRALPPEPKPQPASAPSPCHSERSEEPPHCSKGRAHSNISRHPDPEHSQRGQRAVEGPRETTPATTSGTTSPPDPTAPKTINITKDSLVYFLRSRHCYGCNTELFPPEELTERAYPGAPAEIIEEVPRELRKICVVPTLHAVAESPSVAFSKSRRGAGGDRCRFPLRMTNKKIGKQEGPAVESAAIRIFCGGRRFAGGEAWQ